MGGLLRALKTGTVRGLFGAGRNGTKGPKQLATLRGASNRAYAFEIYAREGVPALWEEAAVYCYASPAPERTDAAGYHIGYIGRTSNMARQHGEHERLRHFAGLGLDTVLVLRIAQALIREDVERDLLALYRPPLNDTFYGASRAGVG
jgi:hypothetical protein